MSIWVWIAGWMKARDTEGPEKWGQVVGIKVKEEHFGKKLVLKSHGDIQVKMPTSSRRFRSAAQEKGKATNIRRQKTFHI